jgi:hypothetical protein
MRCPLRIAGFALLLASAARADVGHAMPPGQEDLVAEMLGRGEELGGCRLVQVDMHPSAIEGTYRCQEVHDGVAVVLEYPSTDSRMTFSTLKFAVSARGPAPEALLDALRRRILEHEAGWHWLAANDALPAPATGAGAGAGAGWVWFPPATACAAMLLVVAYGLVRGRKDSSR